jgi:hypothetical protein
VLSVVDVAVLCVLLEKLRRRPLLPANSHPSSYVLGLSSLSVFIIRSLISFCSAVRRVLHVVDSVEVVEAPSVVVGAVLLLLAVVTAAVTAATLLLVRTQSQILCPSPASHDESLTISPVSPSAPRPAGGQA